MAGHVEFDHDAHAAQARVLDEARHVGLRVPLARRVRTSPQLRVRLRLHREGLRVDHVPMQHIDLGVGQRVDEPLNRAQRLEVATFVVRKTPLPDTAEVVRAAGINIILLEL